MIDILIALSRQNI